MGPFLRSHEAIFPVDRSRFLVKPYDVQVHVSALLLFVVHNIVKDRLYHYLCFELAAGQYKCAYHYREGRSARSPLL